MPVCMKLLQNKLQKLDLIFMICAFVLVALYVAIAGGGFPLDDSWIHQTYARNLALRGEWAFIPGQPSAASTSPLYTVLLSIAYTLHLPYALWTHFLGALALGITAMLARRMVAWFLPTVRIASIVTGFMILGTWHLIWAAASGMETMLFSMLTLSLIYLAWREQFVDSSLGTSWRGIIFGIVAALCTLTRPEGIMLVGIIGFVLLISQPRGLAEVLVYGMASAIAFVLVMSPYLLLNYQLTGGFLPNTAGAKFQQHAILLQLPYLTRIKNLLIAILAGGQVLLIPSVLFFVWHLLRKQDIRKNLLLFVPLLWIIALIGIYAGRLPADYQHGRYVIPILPSLVLIGTIGLFLLVEQAKYQLILRVLSRALFASTLLLSGAFALVLAPPIYATDVAIINEEMVASAQWIEEHIPTNDLLAIHDIGAVGYFSPRPMLDTAGLVSSDVVPIVDDADALWSLMQDRDARYLMAFPDQIPGDSPSDPRLCLKFVTNGKTAKRVGGPNMAIYRLAWDKDCANE